MTLSVTELEVMLRPPSTLGWQRVKRKHMTYDGRSGTEELEGNFLGTPGLPRWGKGIPGPRETEQTNEQEPSCPRQTG